jgi:cytochrome c oxidase subunit II
MRLLRRCAGLALPLLPLLHGVPAFAQSQGAPGGVIGEPHDWQISLQPGYSPVMRDVVWLNNDIVTPIIVVICVLVAALLGYVLWRFNAARNPVPSRLTHNAPLEIAWTVLPALVLVGMAIPSFRLVFFENRTNDPYMTLNVTGHQWYWEYDYPGQGNLDFMSNLIPQDQLKPGEPRLLTVNHPLVLPVGENIRILETSGDVIHSFFIPSLGVQRYAIPGQTIETWVKIDQPGTFYGECNQICGLGHHEMPIEVQGVPLPQFLAWAKLAKQQMAENGSVPPVSAVLPGGTVVASADQGATTEVAEATHREVTPPAGSSPGKGD